MQKIRGLQLTSALSPAGAQTMPKCLSYLCLFIQVQGKKENTHKWLAKSIIRMLYNLSYTNPKLSDSQMGTVPRNKVIGKKEAEF